MKLFPIYSQMNVNWFWIESWYNNYMEQIEMKHFERRLPRDMVIKKKRVPVSARILEETNAVLMVHAKKNQLSLAELVAHILDDYVIWLVKALKEEEDKKKPSNRA